MKYHPALRPEFTITFQGGDKVFPSYIRRERPPGTCRPIIGHVYVVLLNRAYFGTLVAPFNTDSLFDVTDGRVWDLNPGIGPWEGMAAESFIAALR